MKLSQKALDAIRERALFPHLAIALKVSVASIYRYVSINDDNLTKAASLEVLKRETGLQACELLEADTVRV